MSDLQALEARLREEPDDWGRQERRKARILVERQTRGGIRGFLLEAARRLGYGSDPPAGRSEVPAGRSDPPGGRSEVPDGGWVPTRR